MTTPPPTPSCCPVSRGLCRQRLGSVPGDVADGQPPAVGVQCPAYRGTDVAAATRHQRQPSRTAERPSGWPETGNSHGEAVARAARERSEGERETQLTG